MFKFELGALVKVGSYEGTAEVIARAEYVDRPTLYLCKYKNQIGIPVEDWFDEAILS